MPNSKCASCGNDFYAKPSQLSLGWGKYCSRKCQGESQKKGRYVKCHTCTKSIWRMPQELNKSASKLYFCSKACSMAWKNNVLRSGPCHPLWKGGVSVYRKYLINSNSPIVCDECGTEDKRVLLVHHKDRNRKNNSLNNLKWLCHNCHYLEHEGKTI